MRDISHTIVASEKMWQLRSFANQPYILEIGLTSAYMDKSAFDALLFLHTRLLFFEALSRSLNAAYGEFVSDKKENVSKILCAV